MYPILYAWVLIHLKPYIGDQNIIVAENGNYRMTEKRKVHFDRKQFHPSVNESCVPITRS